MPRNEEGNFLAKNERGASMNSITKTIQGKMGFKTIAGAIVIGLSAALLAVNVITPEQHDILRSLGEAFGLFGLRDAVSKRPISAA